MRYKNFVLRFSIASLLSLLVAFSAFAQSTNQSSPTVIEANEYTGKGPSKETNYFFSFTGGPGEITVSIELKAKSFSTFARMEVFDSGMRTVATANMNAATTTGAGGESRSFTLPAEQKVLIKLTLDANLASYKISLGGAVATSETGSATPDKSKLDNLKKNLDITKLPKPVSVPKTGTMTVRMKDGTIHEFNLPDVAGVVVSNQ